IQSTFCLLIEYTSIAVAAYIAALTASVLAHTSHNGSLGSMPSNRIKNSTKLDPLLRPHVDGVISHIATFCYWREKLNSTDPLSVILNVPKRIHFKTNDA
ncbi:hypothetical protein T440DRAFT_524862, partial [Plenodomus tracheiphilus IPT5]